MNTSTIRRQLHNYLEVADEKKLKAIYTMLEDEISQVSDSGIEYTAAEKKELDRRVKNYLNGERTVSAAEMNKRLKTARKKKN
jgi:hypothetical protein